MGAPHRRDRWWAVAWPTLGDEADRGRGERLWSAVLAGPTPFGSDTWSTPTGDDANNVTRKSGAYKSLTRDAQVQAARSDTWPTPQANEDAAGTPAGKMQRMLGNHPAVRGETPAEWATGSLNPSWVCTLMGYPIGYTLPEGEPMRELPSRWPAGLGAPQHDWEPPRLTNEKRDRANRLKALGNSIVPQVARLWLSAIAEESR